MQLMESRHMNRFVHIVDAVSEYTGKFAYYLIIPLILTVVYSVIVRYFFNDIVDWAFEVSLFLHGIMVMVGGGYALKYKAHVRVDIISSSIGPKWGRYLDLLSLAIVILVCIVIAYLGTKAAWSSTLRLERSSLQTPFDPPIWWYRWIIPFSAAIVGFQAVAEVMKIVRPPAANTEPSL